MKKRLTSPAYYFGWACIAAMAYLIYINLTPYWNLTFMDLIEGLEENNFMVTTTPSIQSVIWFPKPNHIYEVNALAAALEIPTKAFDLKDFVYLPILAFVGSFVGILISFFNGHKWIASIAPIVCGAAGWYSFAANPMLNVCTEQAAHHKMVSIIVFAAGCVHLVLALIPVIIAAVKKKKAAA